MVFRRSLLRGTDTHTPATRTRRVRMRSCGGTSPTGRQLRAQPTSSCPLPRARAHTHNWHTHTPLAPCTRSCCSLTHPTHRSATRVDVGAGAMPSASTGATPTTGAHAERRAASSRPLRTQSSAVGLRIRTWALRHLPAAPRDSHKVFQTRTHTNGGRA